ncbi:N-acetyl-gamma-glutamyl-phosphate reductase [Saliniradius amylolyticus]|uniref:N-acetyl-gamma-glutamyl-phosphate reductase n=1 Tax=Saliniradius amylolyticus TaxID=2183582 RepID=A0A2S2E6E0_9ALTE|nr:N-acetyl-gamma-glutamyl-phosphate reductase [Saliniradius amylolyticus]AWL13211.1 N-acetyl-gamma-glutamyl-phosphate reductase [Saliniradius amylolyticus]
MMKSFIFGASGYSGAQLAALIQHHPNFELAGLGVSQHSQDAHKPLSDLYGQLKGQVDAILQPINESNLSALKNEMDLIFLATPHEVSQQWVPILAGGKAKILDLSGAFRLSDSQQVRAFYDFSHSDQALAESAVYGLVDWYADTIAGADLVAVPGCYPTASLLALKPLQQAGLLNEAAKPVVNAVSGVSGAGRKAALKTSFCEVSLQAYGVLGHRHQPEIAQELGAPVIFTPHLGNFKRGILATITAQLKPGVDDGAVWEAFHKAYKHSPLIRLIPGFPKLDDVVGSAYCDIGWKCQGQDIVIGSAIDNLLKGAAAQALQCANLVADLPMNTGLNGGKP